MHRLRLALVAGQDGENILDAGEPVGNEESLPVKASTGRLPIPCVEDGHSYSLTWPGSLLLSQWPDADSTLVLKARLKEAPRPQQLKNGRNETRKSTAEETRNLFEAAERG